MNNPEHDLSSTSLGSTNQTPSMMFNMPQHNQQMPFNNRNPYYANTSMNMPSQNSLPSNQQNIPSASYNSYSFPMQGNMMMSNSNPNMMSMNYDWMQSSMGAGPNAGLSTSMGSGMNTSLGAGMNPGMSSYNNQMFNPMSQGINSADFLAMANNMLVNSMYRNPTAQPGNMMNPNLMQSMSNTSQMVNQPKIDDLLSNNMNNLNNFYSYINSQNRDMISGMGYNNNSSYPSMTPQKTNDYQNESMQLPSKTEFMQPMMNNSYQGYDMGGSVGPGKNFQGNDNTNTDSFIARGPNSYGKQAQGAPQEEEKPKSTSRFGNRDAGRGNEGQGDVVVSAKNREEEQVKKTGGSSWDDQPVGGKKGGMSWDDQPVGAKGGNSWDDQPVGGKKGGMSWDDQPIGGKQGGGNTWEEKPVGGAKKSANAKSKAAAAAAAKKKKEEVYEEEDNDNYYMNNNNANEYKNPYDEVQIGGKANKRFEDLLEEQLRANPEAIAKQTKKKADTGPKTFLKRGQRAFLSSAAQREPKILDESSQKDYMGDDTGTRSSQTTFKANRPSSKPAAAKSARETVDGNGGLGNGGGNKGGDKPKEPKKFLTRGGGKGGGIGNPADKTEKNDKSEKIEKTERNEKSRKSIRMEESLERNEEERPKSAYPKGKVEHKKGVEDYNEKPIKSEKGFGRLGGKEQTKTETSYNFEENDTQNIDKDYDFGKYAKKSPRGGQQGKKLEVNAKVRQRSPKYTFDDENNEEEDEGHEQEYGEEIPVSNLVNKYFYKGKATTGKSGKGEEKEKEEEVNQDEEIAQKFVNEKIETLNSEIARFKLENERVKKIRQKHDEMLKALNKEMADWNKQKEKEMREFEDWKQEEMKKIKNEKKLAERHQKTVSNMPSRKEREEIDNLKKQIAKLAEELQMKDKRGKLNVDRLKRQIEEAEQRNGELVEELKSLGKYNPKLAAKNEVKSKYEDEEEYHENNEEEEQDHNDEDREDVEHNEDKSGEENESDNENLNYEDIVNQPGGKNAAPANKAAYNSSLQSPKFVNEKVSAFSAPQGKPGKQVNEKEAPSVVKPKTETYQRSGSTNEEPKAASNQVKFSMQDYRFDSNSYFKRYMTNKNEVSRIVNQNVAADGKRVYADGKKEVIFHNGVKREIFPDGYTIVHFINNDIKQTLPDNTVIYFFADAQTTQTTLPNGRHIYRFANNQIELHNADGSKDIYFADQTRKIIYPSGDEETIFTDGTVQRVNAQKIKTITYVNGQKDVVYPDGTKIRTFPDGRVKKYYPDGTSEDL